MEGSVKDSYGTIKGPASTDFLNQYTNTKITQVGSATNFVTFRKLKSRDVMGLDFQFECGKSYTFMWAIPGSEFRNKWNLVLDSTCKVMDPVPNEPTTQPEAS